MERKGPERSGLGPEHDGEQGKRVSQEVFVTLPSPQGIATARLGVSPGSRTVRVIQVVLPDNVRGILEIRGWLPGVFRNVVPLPVDEVLPLSPEKPGVFDGVDFVLLMVINEIRWRWRIDMLDGEDRRFVWTKKRFIEDSVPCGRTRGSKSIGGSPNLGINDVGSNLAMVQLLAGSIGRQIDGMEPDEVACFVVYGIPPIPVIVGLH